MSTGRFHGVTQPVMAWSEYYVVRRSRARFCRTCSGLEWHEPDVPMRTINVRLSVKSRPNASALVTAAVDPKRALADQFCCAAQRSGATTSAATRTGLMWDRFVF